jgi:hypothetical protein
MQRTDLGGLHHGAQITDFNECILVLDGVAWLVPFQVGVVSRLAKYNFCNVYGVSSGAVISPLMHSRYTAEERAQAILMATRAVCSCSTRRFLNVCQLRELGFATSRNLNAEFPALRNFESPNVTIVFLQPDGSRRSELVRSFQDWERCARFSSSIYPLSMGNSEGASDPVAMCAEDFEPRHLGRRIVRIRHPTSAFFWLALIFQVLRGNGPRYLFETGERAADTWLLQGGGAEGAPGISVLQNALHLPSQRRLIIRVLSRVVTLGPLTMLGALTALALPSFLALWRSGA